MTKLVVTFEGLHVGEDGVPLEDLQAALGHLQSAFRHMVEHLRGGADQPGPPTEPMRRVGLLRQGAPSAGSVEVELVLSAESDNGEAPADHCLAVERLLGWREDLGEDGDQFPPIVVEELAAIGSDLSPAVSAVCLADPVSGRCLEWRRKIAEPLSEQIEGALLHGWLKEVNWHDRTAQLHRGDGSYVPLCFDASLDWEMLRLATSFVDIRGQGYLDDDADRWETVHVEQISGTRSRREPCDLEAFRNNPNPKIFNPDEIETIDLSDEEWEAFNQAIREGRSWSD